jgi:Ni/Fe-hydrogenase subunit HybB-like protein
MHHKPYPLQKPFFTPGVYVLLTLMLAGGVTILARFIGGIGYVSNLSNAYPWGLWIGIDVASGVALAAGGFTTAALAHILGKHHYEPVIRPALLTAALGYTFVVLGLLVDIGRSWAIWKPMFFWNTNSVLFEVAMCVMCYLNVLYIEFLPIITEQFKSRFQILGILEDNLNKIMWIFVIAGVVLSCMHQSSLGSLMLIAPTKLHPLWYTPILPLLFLLSAIAVGYPMVIFETTLITCSMKLEDEMDVLAPLSKFSIYLLGLYMIIKIGDMIVRGTYVYLFDFTAQSNSFLCEVVLGVILPWILLCFTQVRESRKGLFTVSILIIFGVVLNRINVFITGFQPVHSISSYFPSVGEILVTTGLIATLMLIYRIAVTWLPVLSAKEINGGVK